MMLKGLLHGPVGFTRWVLLGVLACLPACEFHCGSGGPRRGPSALTAGNIPIAQAGPETWTVDGTSVQIDGTYYLDLTDGLQYTVEHTIAAEPPTSRDAALVIAWPLISYAYREKKHLRTSITKNGSSVSADRIGVALVKRDGAQQRGFRVTMSSTEIEGRLRASVPASSSPSPSSS